MSCFSGVRPIWDAQLAHPFVRGLATFSSGGTLCSLGPARLPVPDGTSRGLFAWAVAKADRLESMGWYAAVLHLTLNTEMALHCEYSQRFGITPAELEAEPMWPTTRAYTDFLIRTAADGDIADLVAALLPCVWGYTYIAQHLARGKPPADQRYADWISQYASPSSCRLPIGSRPRWKPAGRGRDPRKRRRLMDILRPPASMNGCFGRLCWKGESWPIRVELRI